jgi:hypothetical protein
MPKLPTKPKPQKPKTRKPRDRGPHGFSIPVAGAMVGLGRNASYAAAARGEIPTIPFGALKIVPAKPWLRKIGADDAA